MNDLNLSNSVRESVISPLNGLFWPCVRSAIFVVVVTGVIYPLLTTGVAQRVLPQQANGSLIEKNGVTVGSAVIGQFFTDMRYFHPRPSTTMGPDPHDAGKMIAVPYNAGVSAGSNQGPTNQALIDTVAQRVIDYRKINDLPANALVPVDAVTASGSGLDPHISVANAQAQAARVAEARGLTFSQVQQLLTQHIEGRVLGLLGEPRVNVLILNIALDSLPVSADAAQIIDK
ncbi:K+-transporting ATPase ATPase C chain [Nitrosomonas eutropha]|uniref:Potassium-transporting ATPase KdpC subunit n=1 Tax=Nitrosomonas eutropha TaxID=916 RepID=A0A1I7GCC9_9PROT|nr:K(+)-transporting ATPase subunit C [Nitrosomonas eutropha]SFU45916.1 K+-transporting ATPase ATPase C chain [Nitrosomonas eutropha]